MTTTSYPIQGKNLTSAAWSKMQRRQHQGIDTGLGLTLSSTSNDATIATGRANFYGFELEVTVAHVVTLAAAIGSPVTYVIGVLYDPADEGLDPDGPLSIVSGVKGAITVPSGGALWPIWEITRQPSQTLNLATVKSFRTFRASALFTGPNDTDPDTAAVQGAQVLVRRTGIKVNDGVGSGWVDVKDDTGDRTDGITTPTDWAATGTTWRVLNGLVNVDLRGVLTSGSGQTGNGTTGGLNDFKVLTLPVAARPKRTQAVAGSITVASGGTYPIFGLIQSNGDFIVTATAPGIAVTVGAQIFASASYLI